MRMSNIKDEISSCNFIAVIINYFFIIINMFVEDTRGRAVTLLSTLGR